MTKILVTGATGTVGQEVVRALREQGIAVRAGARVPEKLADLQALGAETVRLDFGDPASLEEALAGIERVFLLTPFVEDDLPLIEAVVQAAKDAGAQFLLRMSASGADPEAPAALARHHGLGEEVVKKSGLAWNVIRPNFFMDNFVNYSADAIKGQGAFYGASGEGKTAYISSADIGACAAAILAAPDAHAAKTYDLSGGEAMSDGEVAAILSDLLGREVRFVSVSLEEMASSLRSQGTPDWQVEALQFLETVKANSWAAAVSPAVEEILGRPPETMRTFLQRNKARLS